MINDSAWCGSARALLSSTYSVGVSMQFLSKQFSATILHLKHQDNLNSL